jgi:hypothetical protein
MLALSTEGAVQQFIAILIVVVIVTHSRLPLNYPDKHSASFQELFQAAIYGVIAISKPILTIFPVKTAKNGQKTRLRIN